MVQKVRYVVFSEGSRENLHPKLKILDEINCCVEYDKMFKCIFVDYDFDPISDTFKKGIFTTNFNTVVDIIQEFITD